jgi:uncharacterized membrane protein
MRKRLPVLIFVVAVVASVASYVILPEADPSAWDITGRIHGPSPRFFEAASLPLVIGLFLLAIRWVPIVDPKQHSYSKFRVTFEQMVIGVATFLLVIHLSITASVLGYLLSVGTIFLIAFGLLLIVIGNLLPRTRPNWFIGIRTPWTLSDDRVWERTHRIAGYAFVTLGVVYSLVGILGAEKAPRHSGQVWPTMTGRVFNLTMLFAATVLVLVIYSYVDWRLAAYRAAHTPVVQNSPEPGKEPHA